MGPVHFHSNLAYRQLILIVVCCTVVFSVLTVKTVEGLLRVTLIRVRNLLQAPQIQW